MEDLFGVVVFIFVILSFIGQNKKKMEQQKKTSPVKPVVFTTQSGQSTPVQQAATVQPKAEPERPSDAQLERERQQERRALEEKHAQERVTERMASRLSDIAIHPLSNAMSMGGSMDVGMGEGEDPCHDQLYDSERSLLTDDAYAMNRQEETQNTAAKAWMHGVILSEVLKTPRSGWRVPHR